MRSLLLWIGAGFLISSPALGQILGSKFTHPQPPVYKKEQPRYLPSMEIPLDPSQYKWRTTSKFDGRKVEQATTDVRVFLFDRGRRTEVGRIPEGTEVKLDVFRKAGRTLYWRIPWQGSNKGVNTTKFAWLSGRNIEMVPSQP